MSASACFGRLPVLAAIFLSAMGCGAGNLSTTDVPKPVETRTSFLERWLVMSGPKTTPMRVVTNDINEGDALLRVPSRSVEPADSFIRHLADRMLATVEQQKGVGIAAPQVGLNLRMIWVKRLDKEPEKPWGLYLNPVIDKMSTDTVEDWEGCLSIAAGFGKVARAAWIVVEYDTLDGEHVQEKVSGFTARIFQHEIDHLDGVLFIDRRPEDSPPLVPKDEYRKMKEANKQPTDTPTKETGKSRD